MNYSDLVDDGRIKRGRLSRKQVEDCLRIARRDVATAAAVIETSPDPDYEDVAARLGIVAARPKGGEKT